MQKFAINTYHTIRIIRRRTVEVPKTKPIALVKKRSYKFAAKLPLRRITMIVAKNSVNYPYFKGVSNPRTRNILSLLKLVTLSHKKLITQNMQNIQNIQNIAIILAIARKRTKYTKYTHYTIVAYNVQIILYNLYK